MGGKQVWVPRQKRSQRRRKKSGGKMERGERPLSWFPRENREERKMGRKGCLLPPSSSSFEVFFFDWKGTLETFIPTFFPRWVPYTWGKTGASRGGGGGEIYGISCQGEGGNPLGPRTTRLWHCMVYSYASIAAAHRLEVRRRRGQYRNPNAFPEFSHISESFSSRLSQWKPSYISHIPGGGSRHVLPLRHLHQLGRLLHVCPKPRHKKGEPHLS